GLTPGAAASPPPPPVPGPEPLAALTVADPVPLAGAVYRPLLLTVPILPVPKDQVIAGCVLKVLPNWSRALAANCCVAPLGSVTLTGLTLMPVSVWLTVTLTLLVAVKPPASRI